MLPTKIKVVGFDLDQTLYPKSPEIDEAIQNYLYDQISQLRGVSVGEAKELFNGLYKAGKGLSGSNSLVEIGFPKERARELVQEALENAEIAKFLVPDQRVLTFLQKIKTKYKYVDLITGSNKKNTLKKLDKLGISPQLFANIITADDASKSDLSAFKMWLHFYPQYQPRDFLYIGDRKASDYDKPRELGIGAILIEGSVTKVNL